MLLSLDVNIGNMPDKAKIRTVNADFAYEQPVRTEREVVHKHYTRMLQSFISALILSVLSFFPKECLDMTHIRIDPAFLATAGPRLPKLTAEDAPNIAATIQAKTGDLLIPQSAIADWRKWGAY